MSCSGSGWSKGRRPPQETSCTFALGTLRGEHLGSIGFHLGVIWGRLGEHLGSAVEYLGTIWGSFVDHLGPFGDSHCALWKRGGAKCHGLAFQIARKRCTIQNNLIRLSLRIESRIASSKSRPYCGLESHARNRTYAALGWAFHARRNSINPTSIYNLSLDNPGPSGTA